MKHLTFITAFILITALFSCNNENEKVTTSYKEVNLPTVRDTLKKVNRFFMRKDKELIQSYIKRRKWNMKETKSGLWYEIYELGTGKKLQKNEKVQLKYKIELLDGTFCYSSDKKGLKTVSVGKIGEESGLDEAVLMLKHGDKARFIMSPYMAHGATGDNNKIPPFAIIVYFIEVI